MSQDDYMQTADDIDVDLDPPPSRPPRVHRPLNGGWTLMVAAGFIAAMANYALLTMGDDGTVEVAVLHADAPAGTPVEQLDVGTTRLGLDDPAAHQLTDPATLSSMSGMVTATRLGAGVLVRTADLRVPSGAGHSAMSVPIDTSRAVGGLLQAGDRIDVIATEGDGVGYVVRDVQIIEVTDRGQGIGATSGTYAVTVSVDDEQALALATALRDGAIDIVRTATGDGG